MKEFTYAVSDKQGLHALSAMRLAKTAETYKSRIFVSAGSGLADCKNVIALMGLTVRQGDKMAFCIIGEDEKEAFDYLEALLPTIL